MGRTRILLAGMPQTVLSDIVEQVAAHRPDMEIVGHKVQRSQLPESAVKTGANVVILRLEEDELPGACTDILNHVPGAVVVGLISDGRRLILLADNLGTSELMTTIRAARGSLIEVASTDGEH